MTAEIPTPPELIRHVNEVLLATHGVDTRAWGTGSAKTPDHLNAELEANEAVLVLENGKLVRITRILGVDVCCATDTGMKILREVRQQFKDGRTRSRNLPTSLGEKLTPDEDEITGLYRALSEELNVDMHAVLSIGKINDESRERESESFPGILTRSVIHNYAVLIDPTTYNPSGYTEDQEDKSTYFGWI